MSDAAPSTQSTRALIGSSILEAVPGWMQSNVALSSAIAGIGLALTMFRLGAPSLWMDEAFSVELARKPLSTLWLVCSSGGEANMVLYYVILHGWLNLLNLIGAPSLELEVRLPSALFASASAVVVFMLGRKYVSQLVGGIAAVLLLLNGFVLATAQFTRSYSLQLLLVTLSWYALLNALTSDRRVWSWWMGYALLTGASLYAQLSTVFIVCSQIVFLAVLALAPTDWRARARARIWPAVLSLFAIGVLFAPIALTSQGISKTGWIPSPTLRDFRALYLVYAFGVPRWEIFGLLLCCATAIVAAILFFARRRHAAENHPNSEFQSARRYHMSEIVRRPMAMEAVFLLALLCWLTIPVVAAFVVSQGATRVFSTRYLVIIIPALVLLISTIAMLPRVWLLRVTFLSAFFIPAVVGAISYYPNAQIEDWRTPARWIEQHYQPGDGLVTYNNSNQQGAQFPMQYYLHSDGSQADLDADTPGVVLWERLPEADPFAHYQDALDPQALSRYAALHHRFFFVAGRLSGPDDVAKVQATISWLNSHYQLLGQSSDSTAATVLLYSAP
jgi:mannosyltransferase